MMSESVPDLKQLEKKAFRLFHQDGVMDMYLGLLLAQIGVEELLLEGSSSSLRYVVLFAGLTVSFLLFWSAKTWITKPRLGHVKFGQNRKAAKAKMVILMCLSVLFNVVLLILTRQARTQPELAWFRNLNDAVIPIGLGAWITLLIIVVGYFMENNRLMYYAVFFGGSFTAAMLLDTALPFVLVGAAMLVIGLVIFITFLKDYPVIKAGGNEGE